MDFPLPVLLHPLCQGKKSQSSYRKLIYSYVSLHKRCAHNYKASKHFDYIISFNV